MTVGPTAQPLTPPECDLRDFEFMPLDVRRLRDSDLAALESPEACWAAVLLWGASWHQVPAASLPDDDRVLSQLAGYGRVVREWQRVRDGALRGWVKCTDGRLYHPVVAEKAREAWESKLYQRWRTELARIKKSNERNASAPKRQAPSFEEFRDRGLWKTANTAAVCAPCPEGQGRMSPGTHPNVPSDKAECPEGHAVQGTGTGTGISTPLPLTPLVGGQLRTQTVVSLAESPAEAVPAAGTGGMRSVAGVLRGCAA